MNPKCPFCNRVLRTGWLRISLGTYMMLGIIPISRTGLNRAWLCNHCKRGWLKGKSIITKKTSRRFK